MTNHSNDQSMWRIELARDLIPFYACQKNIKMIVLGGSPSRNLSDAYSDLDIVVFWDEIDLPWLENGPLKKIKADRVMFRQMGEDVFLESYFFETLKVDFGHTTLKSWEQETAQVITRLEPDQDIQKSIAGFLDAIPLHGHDLINQWQEKLRPYPEGLTEKIVRQNLGFFVKGCLLNQGLKRGDVLFYYDGTCLILKRLLAILAALNRHYFSNDEPRWIEYELSTMTIKPDNMVQRIHGIFQADGPTAMTMLDNLVEEVIELIEMHVPSLNLSRLKKASVFEVRACRQRPSIPLLDSQGAIPSEN
ncbi:hypothetical protein JXQ70_16420 [bacterium]|nr:hypothetical protein [bacterium]